MKRNSNQILYKKALKLISNETDYFNILKKLQEIEKLKLLLLSPEQIQLFNMLSKPMIFENELLSEENKNFDGFMLSVMIENSKKLNNTDNITNILNYYKRIKERKGNEIDERLVELIDRSLQEYINNKKESNISLDN